MPDVNLPGGIAVPIPSWAIQAFGVVAVVSISAYSYTKIFPKEEDLVSVQQANHMLRLEVDEYNKHILESPPITLADPGNIVRVAAYEDGCVLVSRRFAGMATTRLLVDPARADITHTAGDRIGSYLPPLVTPVAAQGRCLNPHPGPFVWRYGAKLDQCWVEVWRAWPATKEHPGVCEHVQLFNACANAWATNADGSPQVRWTQCAH